MDDVLHPDVLVEFLPSQSPSLDAQTDLRQQFLGSLSQERIFGCRETQQPLIGQFEPDATALNPATQRRSRQGGFSVVHGIQDSKNGGHRGMLWIKSGPRVGSLKTRLTCQVSLNGLI